MSTNEGASAGPDRRTVLKGLAGTVVGAGLCTGGSGALANRPQAGARESGPDSAWRMTWSLPRPKPALFNSYLWTWDHSANWVWDDPGMLNFGAINRYLKQPGTYLEDYRRLVDLASGLGVRGLVVWGFLREAHGGIESAKRVAGYARSKNVVLMPGVGTNWYGGPYYEGEHPYNIQTFLDKHPDVRLITEKGDPSRDRVCPSHPRFKEWLQSGVRWLFREFDVGGANLENGDFLVCHCRRCTRLRADWPANEPEFMRHQYMGYAPALRAIEDQLGNKLVTWAAYGGFLPGKSDKGNPWRAYMECARPALVDKLPPDGVCQWTLSGMVRGEPLPLTEYLDNGTPTEALASERWPAAITPPSVRSSGYLHQGSQWHRPGRTDLNVSTIKEACLRAHRAGLEGVSIHAEVSAMHIPAALNYLAFSHFIHWPADSLRQFGTKTLSHVLGAEDDAGLFVELFARWDAGVLTDTDRKAISGRTSALERAVRRGRDLIPWRFWNWLRHMAEGVVERHTASVF